MRIETVHNLLLRDLGANVHEIEDANGNRMLFSYSMPVAVYIAHRGYFRTEEKVSATTEKHIGQWLPVKATSVPQELLDAALTIREPKP